MIITRCVHRNGGKAKTLPYWRLRPWKDGLVVNALPVETDKQEYYGRQYITQKKFRLYLLTRVTGMNKLYL